MILNLSEMELGHLRGLVQREMNVLNLGEGLSCHLCNFSGSREWPWPRCSEGRGPVLKCPHCGEPNRHWHRFGELEALRARLYGPNMLPPLGGEA